MILYTFILIIVKGGCVPCPDKKVGDGVGGCICDIGLEEDDIGICRPAF